MPARSATHPPTPPQAGWATAELAVRFTEAYAALLGAGRLLPCERRYVRLVQAALRHPSLR